MIINGFCFGVDKDRQEGGVVKQGLGDVHHGCTLSYVTPHFFHKIDT